MNESIISANGSNHMAWPNSNNSDAVNQFVCGCVCMGDGVCVRL